MDIKYKYIAKPDNWFKAGTEAKLIEFYYAENNGKNFGLFEGTYVVCKNEGYDTFWHKKGYKKGDEVQMREVCAYDEFEIIEV
jgi:hypothetical protein